MNDLNIDFAEEEKEVESKETTPDTTKSDEELIAESNEANYGKKADKKGGEGDSATPKDEEGKEKKEKKEKASQDVKTDELGEGAPKRITGIDKRIGKLTKRNKGYEKIITGQGKEIAELTKKVDEFTKPKEPNPKDYDLEEEDPKYLKDYIDWTRKVDVGQPAKPEKPEPKVNDEIEDYGDYEDEEDEETVDIENFRHDITEEYDENVADAVFGKYMSNKIMREFILTEGKNGIQFGVYLDKHHAEANRISKLSDIKTLRECEAITTKLNSKGKTKTGAPQIIGEDIKGEVQKTKEGEKSTAELLVEADKRNYPEKYLRLKNL